MALLLLLLLLHRIKIPRQKKKPHISPNLIWRACA